MLFLHGLTAQGFWIHALLVGYNIGAYAVQSRRAVRHWIAIFADLQFPVGICGTNYELGLAYLFRHPFVAPETPRDFCAWLRDLRLLPRLAVVGTNLDLRDSAVAAERHSAQLGNLAENKRLREMIARDLRRIETGMCRDHIAETAPALLLVKTTAMAPMEARVRFVQQLDPRQPLWVFLAI